MSPSPAMNSLLKRHENYAFQHKNIEFSILVWKLKNYSLPWHSRKKIFKAVQKWCQMSKKSAEINCLLSEEWVSTIICEPRKSSVLFEPINVRQSSCWVGGTWFPWSWQSHKQSPWESKPLTSLLRLKIQTLHVPHFWSTIPIKGILYLSVSYPSAAGKGAQII